MSTLEFCALTIRNFASVGNITQAVVLNSNALTLIMGKNSDAGADNNRNGTGKSTILNAISYVLYGEPISNVNLDNLVNNINAKNMLVTIDFKKDGHTYRIERGRKPNIFNYFIDGSDQKKGNNSFSQNDILLVIGMSHMMFTHLIGMNTYTPPFLKLKAAEQRELTEELLGVSLLSQRDEVAKKLVSDTKKAIDIAQASIKSTIEANSRIEDAIRRTENEAVVWENARNIRLINLNSALQQIDSIDFDREINIFSEIAVYEQTAKELKNEISTITWKVEEKKKEKSRLLSEISNVSKNDNTGTLIARLNQDLEKQKSLLGSSRVDHHVNMLREAIQSSQLDIESYNEKIIGLSEELEHFQSHLESDDHFCNACGQKFASEEHLQDAKDKIQKVIDDRTVSIERYLKNIDVIERGIETKQEDVRKSLEDHQAEIKSASIRMQEIMDEIESLKEAQIKNQKDAEEKADLLNAEISLVQQEISELNELLNEMRDALFSLLKPVSQYNSVEEIWALRDKREKLVRDIEVENEKEAPQYEAIKNLQSAMTEVSYDVINGLRDDLAHEEFIHKMLSGKDSFIRKKIIDQNLFYLNSRINDYLNMIGLPHEVCFMSDLSVDITHMGNKYDFPQLSRGQQGRVMLAIAWAFRDIFENLNHKINLLFVDEMLDSGIDDAGAEAGMAILNKMAREQKRNTFLVSHKEIFIGKVDYILLVHLQDQFTSFEIDGVI